MTENSVEVSTLSGRLRGYSAGGYYAFKGIPYARPPLGPLRFHDPEPVEPWDGVREAREHGPHALQMDETGKHIGSEDCLYLNVYTRSLVGRAPVLFWIHGGAFLLGSGDDDFFGPDYFLAKDVVLVTINYRLGVFGFLNLEDELAPGNQGLKDQAAALRWVQRHIGKFGGDPGNVTICGGSAGAGSVHLLATSPLTEGLFHKAICQSGNAFCPWAIKTEPMESVHEFLELLGCEAREPGAIVDFLRSLDCNRLIEAQGRLMTPKRWLQLYFPFGPCVDNKSPQPIVPVEPSQTTIRVPLLTGYNSLEGIIAHAFLSEPLMRDLNDNLESYFLKCCKARLLSDYNLTIGELGKYYMAGEEISEHSLAKFTALWSDLAFNESIHKLIQLQCQASPAPTYAYKLTFDKNESIRKTRVKPDFEGVGHGDEMAFLFGVKMFEARGLEQLPGATKRVMERMTELWTNFATSGRPTVAASELVPIYWQPVAGAEVLRYMNIGEELRMEKMLGLAQTYSFAADSKRAC